MGGGKSGDTEEMGPNDDPITASFPHFSQEPGGVGRQEQQEETVATACGKGRSASAHYLLWE